ncbi:MAG: amino acid permease [Candidatus Omnitrophota bacterium]
MNDTSQGLKRLLGRWDSIAITIGIVIGVGIFRVPAEVAKYLTSPGLIILAWFVAGIICLLGALCYSELSSSFPQTGGNYIYLRESYGRGVGFLFGWTELLVVRTGSIAAVAFISGQYLQSFLALDKLPVKLIATSVVFILSFINILGLRPGKIFQNLSTLAKTLALIAIIILGLSSREGSLSNFLPILGTVDKKILTSFGLALIPILWTYGGWHESTFVTEETKDYRHSLPFSLITAIFIITFIYIAINLVYIYLIPVREIASSELIASNVMQILYGAKGRKILEILVIISSLGCINGMIITGSRVTYAMAKDNPIFRYLGEIDRKHSVPSRSILINAIWTTLLIIWGTFNQLLFFTGIAVWLFFALAVAGIFILRYKFPHVERPFKVWGYPIVPAVFVLICAALAINTLFFYPIESLLGLCLMISGVPVFILSQRRKEKETGRID